MILSFWPLSLLVPTGLPCYRNSHRSPSHTLSCHFSLTWSVKWFLMRNQSRLSTRWMDYLSWCERIDVLLQTQWAQAVFWKSGVLSCVIGGLKWCRTPACVSATVKLRANVLWLSGCVCVSVPLRTNKAQRSGSPRGPRCAPSRWSLGPQVLLHIRADFCSYMKNRTHMMTDVSVCRVWGNSRCTSWNYCYLRWHNGGEQVCVVISSLFRPQKKKIFELCSTGFSPVTKGPQFKSVLTSSPI